MAIIELMNNYYMNVIQPFLLSFIHFIEPSHYFTKLSSFLSSYIPPDVPPLPPISPHARALLFPLLIIPISFLFFRLFIGIIHAFISIYLRLFGSIHDHPFDDEEENDNNKINKNNKKDNNNDNKNNSIHEELLSLLNLPLTTDILLSPSSIDFSCYPSDILKLIEANYSLLYNRSASNYSPIILAIQNELFQRELIKAQTPFIAQECERQRKLSYEKKKNNVINDNNNDNNIITDTSDIPVTNNKHSNKKAKHENNAIEQIFRPSSSFVSESFFEKNIIEEEEKNIHQNNKECEINELQLEKDRIMDKNDNNADNDNDNNNDDNNNNNKTNRNIVMKKKRKSGGWEGVEIVYQSDPRRKTRGNDANKLKIRKEFQMK